MKKDVPKTWNIHRKTFVLESLFNKVTCRQDCCKTYLLHAYLRSYLALGKIFINFQNSKFHQFCINYVLLKNVKCKVMFTAFLRK